MGNDKKQSTRISDDDLVKVIGGSVTEEEPDCCKTQGQPPLECQSLTGNYGPDCKLTPPPGCPRA